MSVSRDRQGAVAKTKPGEQVISGTVSNGKTDHSTGCRANHMSPGQGDTGIDISDRAGYRCAGGRATFTTAVSPATTSTTTGAGMIIPCVWTDRLHSPTGTVTKRKLPATSVNASKTVASRSCRRTQTAVTGSPEGPRTVPVTLPAWTTSTIRSIHHRTDRHCRQQSPDTAQPQWSTHLVPHAIPGISHPLGSGPCQRDPVLIQERDAAAANRRCVVASWIVPATMPVGLPKALSSCTPKSSRTQ